MGRAYKQVLPRIIPLPFLFLLNIEGSFLKQKAINPNFANEQKLINLASAEM